jgi:hypothetical protein
VGEALGRVEDLRDGEGGVEAEAALDGNACQYYGLSCIT